MPSPLRDKQIRTELPNRLQILHCIFLISLNAASISLRGTFPPHIRFTYSGVIPPISIEHDRHSSSINCFKRSTTLFFSISHFLQLKFLWNNNFILESNIFNHTRIGSIGNIRSCLILSQDSLHNVIAFLTTNECF